MSSNNEINFGPVFMRGRKPTSGSKPPQVHPTGNEPGLNSQAGKPGGGGPAPNLRPPIPPLGSFSAASNPPALPLPKSFSAVVSPEKEAEERVTFSGVSNGWDLSHGDHDNGFSSVDNSRNVIANGSGTAHLEYSRETLLNLYSEMLAIKLPPDLPFGDPALSETFVGPPLSLIEMTEAEKELFSGPFNSERRAANKNQHHNLNENQTTPISPDGGTGGLGPNRLSVGSGAKLGKHHSPIERFTNLGIQGGVLAGVASPTHGNRRRGDSENDPPEGTRRFPRPDDGTLQSAGWSATARDRRARDSGPPTDGKWKRGVPLEEKMHLSMEGVATGNHRYSVLDRMREKAAANSDQGVQESTAQGTSSNETGENSDPSDVPPASPHAAAVINHGESTGPPVSAPAPTEETQQVHGKAVEVASEHALEQNDIAPSANVSVSVPSTDTAPEDIAWQYRDPSGTVQGPFTAFQMQEWYKASFFRDDLLLKRVSDIAFETLETLLLRTGDRDTPFLVRPPPALPPNLPLPVSHVQNYQTGNIVHSSPILQRPNLLEPSSFVNRQDSLSVFDSPISAHNHDSNLHHISSVPDPWNSTAQSISPVNRPMTLPSSSPLVTTSGWNNNLPALSQPPNQGANDYNANLVGNGFVPNSFGQPDPLRFLHHPVPHPALVGANNGYPYSLPIPPQPAFGQIPVGHHLFNGSGLDPLMNSQLHSHLGFPAAPYRGNTSMSNNGDLNEAPAEREPHDPIVFAQPTVSGDPWQVHPEQALVSHQSPSVDRNSTLPIVPTPVNSTDSASPTKRDSWMNPLVTSLEPIGTRSSGKNTPSSVLQDLLPASALEKQHNFDAVTTPSVAPEDPASAPTPSYATETPTGFAITQPSVPILANEISKKSAPDEKATINAAKSSSAPRLNNEKTHSQSYVDSRHASQVEPTSTSGEAWHNVTHQPAAKPSATTGTPSTAANVPPPPKQSGKVIVLSRAQQDEQDRRTASIQKTQLQLKEAQAVERAAREASEAAAAAAAAATSASISTPAPWLKEDNKTTSSNLSLMEIQAIESKQSEKRRQAERQAAASRALAEQAAAADRAAKLSKESLPPTSNWAASSSPTKSTTNMGSSAVWGGKDSEGSITSGPKQTMKQIQEEEARRKKLAQQQLANKSAASMGLNRPSGYAGTVATGATKAAASGPWSVVGAKSKVIAPPANGTRPVPTTSVVPGLPTTGRLSSSNSHQTISKTNTSTTRPNATLSTASNKASTGAANVNSAGSSDGPPPASPEFMKWLREALRGMNNVDDFMKMLLDFPINPDESVLEIVSDSVYAGSATLDGRRFAKEFNVRRHADVMARMNNPKSLPTRTSSSSGPIKKTSTMADALKSQPAVKNDGWGFAVVGAKKKKK